MADADSEDDAPPPLADMSSKLSLGMAQHLKMKEKPPPKPAAAAAEAKPMARGFFDAKPKPRRKKAPAKKPEDDGIEVVRPREPPSSVPSAFHVDTGDDKASAFKAAVTDALKPTQDTLTEVMANPSLMEGFDDPEVMAAVADIAKDAKNMKKYANNQKVQRFYKAMAGQVASKFDSMAEAEEARRQQSAAAQQSARPLIAPAAPKRTPKPAAPARKGVVDYSKWDDLDLSDDEDHEASFQKAEFRRLQEQALQDKIAAEKAAKEPEAPPKQKAPQANKSVPPPSRVAKPEVTLPSMTDVAAERRVDDPDTAWKIKPVSTKPTKAAEEAKAAPPAPAAKAPPASNDLFDMD